MLEFNIHFLFFFLNIYPCKDWYCITGNNSIIYPYSILFEYLLTIKDTKRIFSPWNIVQFREKWNCQFQYHGPRTNRGRDKVEGVVG